MAAPAPRLASLHISAIELQRKQRAPSASSRLRLEAASRAVAAKTRTRSSSSSGRLSRILWSREPGVCPTILGYAAQNALEAPQRLADHDPVFTQSQLANG